MPQGRYCRYCRYCIHSLIQIEELITCTDEIICRHYKNGLIHTCMFIYIYTYIHIYIFISIYIYQIHTNIHLISFIDTCLTSLNKSASSSLISSSSSSSSSLNPSNTYSNPRNYMTRSHSITNIQYYTLHAVQTGTYISRQ